MPLFPMSTQSTSAQRFGLASPFYESCSLASLLVPRKPPRGNSDHWLRLMGSRGCRQRAAGRRCSVAMPFLYFTVLRSRKLWRSCGVRDNSSLTLNNSLTLLACSSVLRRWPLFTRITFSDRGKVDGNCPKSPAWILATGRKWWGVSSPVVAFV